MKNNTKILICCLAVAAIITASVMGTLAWLTDADSAVNTFTVGHVDIGLDEEKVTPDGKPTPEDDDRVQGNKYHLLPGQTYVKDPTVTVKAGSEESYIRMLVTINRYDVLQEICNGAFLPQDFVSGWDSDVWISTETVQVSDDGTTATYEFRYHTTVDGLDDEGNAADEKLPALFETFTIPGTFDGEDLEALDGLEINVVGHAIQAAGFDSADLAWESFDEQMKP